MIHRTRVVEKRLKLRVRFSFQKEKCVRQTKISTKTGKDGFLPAVFRSRLGQKNSCYCMFSMSRLCFVFYCEIYVNNGLLCQCSFLLPWHFIPSHYVRRRFPTVSALEFRFRFLYLNKPKAHFWRKNHVENWGDTSAIIVKKGEV